MRDSEGPRLAGRFWRELRARAAGQSVGFTIQHKASSARSEFMLEDRSLMLVLTDLQSYSDYSDIQVAFHRPPAVEQGHVRPAPVLPSVLVG